MYTTTVKNTTNANRTNVNSPIVFILESIDTCVNGSQSEELILLESIAIVCGLWHCVYRIGSDHRSSRKTIALIKDRRQLSQNKENKSFIDANRRSDFMRRTEADPFDCEGKMRKRISGIYWKSRHKAAIVDIIVVIQIEDNTNFL